MPAGKHDAFLVFLITFFAHKSHCPIPLGSSRQLEQRILNARARQGCAEVMLVAVMFLCD